MTDFDLIAIGGGTAGLVASAGAASLGLRVALIERDALGGDCLWTGCVPSKALIASARTAHAMRTAERVGLEPVPSPDPRRVLARLRDARAQVARHDDPERFRAMGVDVRLGGATVLSPHQVRVDGRVLEGKHLLIATGAAPSVPRISGLAETGYFTHHTVFDLDTPPRRLGVLGAGAIGAELAQAFARLGSDVTLVEALDRVLPRDDPDASHVVRDALEQDGVRVHTGTRVERIERGPGGAKRLCARRADSELAIDVDEILVATGRRPNGSGFGLEDVGVRVERGAVVVDKTLRTDVRSIWAAGDVIGGPQFTHVADYHAKLVLRNMIAPRRAALDYRHVPQVTFTDPEVAHVGMRADEARDAAGRVRVFRYDLTDLDRAIVDGHDAGFVKIVTRPNGKILGATIVGPGAGELLPVVILAMRRGIPLKHLSQQVWAYPTMAESVKRTADQWYREGMRGSRGRWIRRVVRWLV